MEGNFLFILSVMVGVTVFFLGAFVYLDNRKSLNNRIFFATTFFTSLWIASVLFSVSSNNLEVILFTRRVAFASATFIAFFIYYFSYNFPRPNRNYKFPLIPLLIFTVIIFTLSLFTPYILENVRFFVGEQVNVYGFGYYVFTVCFFAALISGIYNFVSKKRTLIGIERLQMKFVLAGLITSGALAAFTNLILPRVLGTYHTGQFGPLTVSIFILLTTYALLKHHLFNVKVIAIELLTLVMWLFILFRFLVSNDLQAMVMDGGLLVITVVFGTLLIRSVIKEVKQRENFEKMTFDLESANRRLEKLGNARREFLSFASHQLKTPMTLIKGYAELAAQEEYVNSPPKMRDVVTKIGKSTDQMYRLISNFLNARAIEEGKIIYSFNPTDIVRLTSVVVDEFKPAASEKGLKLTFQSSHPSITYNTDETKLRQVIQNLIDNAIKYTDSGFVKIEVKEENNYIVLSVADSGRGINSDIKDNLFGQFIRSKTAAQTTQGSGLGLYIAKEIVKAHKGEIWAESEGEGKGARFVVRFKKE